MIDIQKYMDNLVLDLRLLRYQYYRYSEPVTTDHLYDMMERLLFRLECQHPEYRSIYSTTTTVGSDLYDEELEALRPEFLERWKDGMRYKPNMGHNDEEVH